MGSNIGDRLAYLKQAIELLSADASIVLTGQSNIYETEPWPKKPLENGREIEGKQGWHLNQVIEVETNLKPEALLKLTQSVEITMGKKKKLTWGSRIIDVDILIYGSEQIKTDDLIIPHPFITQRQFVMIPLLELNDRLVDPVSKKSYLESSKKLGDDHTVKLYSPS